MQVINLNKNGEVIPDLSKVKLPKELSERIYQILNRSVSNDPTKTNSEQRKR